MAEAEEDCKCQRNKKERDELTKLIAALQLWRFEISFSFLYAFWHMDILLFLLVILPFLCLIDCELCSFFHGFCFYAFACFGIVLSEELRMSDLFIFQGFICYAYEIGFLAEVFPRLEYFGSNMLARVFWLEYSGSNIFAQIR